MEELPRQMSNGPGGAAHASPRGSRLARRLALAKVRELRAQGWSYRQIGRYFATAPSAGPPAGEGRGERSVRKRSPRGARAGGAAAADHRAFLEALDVVGEGLAFFDLAGMQVHLNRALALALQNAGAGDELEAEIVRFARVLATELLSEGEAAGGQLRTGELESREIQTGQGRFRLRGSYLAPDLFGRGGSVLVALEGPGLPTLTDAVLRERFGLSQKEIRIARLIAEGCSNAQVAAEVAISPHTARRHTERVFVKLGARSRAEVGRRLLGWDRGGRNSTVGQEGPEKNR